MAEPVVRQPTVPSPGLFFFGFRLCGAPAITRPLRRFSVGLFGPCLFGGYLEVVDAALYTRARRTPLPLRHVSLGIPKFHAIGHAVIGASLLRLLRWRRRICASRLRSASPLRRLTLRGCRRGNLALGWRTRRPAGICQPRRRMQINVRLRWRAVDTRRGRHNDAGRTRCGGSWRKCGSTCCWRSRSCGRCSGGWSCGWRGCGLRQRFTKAYAYHQETEERDTHGSSLVWKHPQP
jgi:hypothetical protein